MRRTSCNAYVQLVEPHISIQLPQLFAFANQTTMLRAAPSSACPTCREIWQSGIAWYLPLLSRTSRSAPMQHPH